MITNPHKDFPEYADVEAAVERLNGEAVRTPLLQSEAINELLGVEVWFKPECLQLTGSFKFRGAWNRISRIPQEQRAAGVVAFSSGNHAQGVAAAAGRLGMPATIVMPADAPESKIQSTRRLGAHVRLYDRVSESREAIGAAISEETGAILVKPYDDAYVIAGQGTATLEAVTDGADSGRTFGAMLCPASGGGLLAGATLVLSERMPDCRLFVAEPCEHDDHARSLKAGVLKENAPGFHSIADALLAPRPGDLTFPINKRFVAGGIAVTDDEIRRAMKLAFLHLKLVVEPGGACAFAALMREAKDFSGAGPVLVMLSGGNVDPATFAAAIQGKD